MHRDHTLQQEGMLGFLGLFVLLPALLLVLVARSSSRPAAPYVLLNTARAADIARALHVSEELGRRAVAARDRSGSFAATSDLFSIPLFTPAERGRLLAAPKLDLSTANGARISRAGSLPGSVGKRFAIWRDATKPLFTPASSAKPVPADRLLARAPLFGAASLDPALARLPVRDMATVLRQFALMCALLAAIAIVYPPLLRRRCGGDPFLVPIALLLSGLGIVLLFSVKDPFRDRAVYIHHFTGLCIGLTVAAVASALRVTARGRMRAYGYVWVFAAAALALLLALFGSGPEGVRLNLLFIQPAELIKLFLVIFAAGYLADHSGLIGDVSRPFQSGREGAETRPRTALVRDLGPLVVMFGASLALFVALKDLGPGLIVFGTAALLLYLSTGRALFPVAALALIVAGGVVGYAGHVGVFATRVEMWLHPFHNARPNGLQLAQSLWGIASGGASGSGLGLGMPGLLPRAGSDLAYASWVEETGFIGGVFVLVLYFVLVWRAIRIGRIAANQFDRHLAYAVGGLLGIQALLIIAGVLGLFPLSGVSLPFLSFGNSSLVVSWFSIGLLRGISAAGMSQRDGIVDSQAQARAPGRALLVYGSVLLGVIGLWRLTQLSIVQCDRIAARPAATPDADGVLRPHWNPRLVAMERAIPRGSIYDARGAVLATSRPREIAGRPAAAAGTRVYPAGGELAHLVGTLSPAVGGPTGIEKQYDAELRGYRSHAEMVREYRARNLPGFRPRVGRDVHVTIERSVQTAAVEALRAGMRKLTDARTHRSKDRGAFVAIDAATGSVLAAATMPTFDPNGLTSDAIRAMLREPTEEHRFINRALYGVYPPGSTLKVAVAAAALDTLPRALGYAVSCNQVSEPLRWKAGGRQYARKNVRDDQGDPKFGRLMLPEAFRVSSNIYFAHLAIAVGAPQLHRALADTMGFRHTPPQKQLDADLPDIGYGQGRMRATPIEMARLASAVANDGACSLQPIVQRTTDPVKRSKAIVTPVTARTFMRPSTARTVAAMMRTVVDSGTARGVFPPALHAAGKTGTAQNDQNDRMPHSWFIGFAPARAGSGRIAFACVVENGGYGKQVAAVICRDFLVRVNESRAAGPFGTGGFRAAVPRAFKRAVSL